MPTTTKPHSVVRLRYPRAVGKRAPACFPSWERPCLSADGDGMLVDLDTGCLITTQVTVDGARDRP